MLTEYLLPTLRWMSNVVLRPVSKRWSDAEIGRYIAHDVNPSSL